MEATTPQSRCQLDRLPNEILLSVIEQPYLSVTDLISLACTNHRYYGVTISTAYKAHVKNEFGLASKSCLRSTPTKYAREDLSSQR